MQSTEAHDFFYAEFWCIAHSAALRASTKWFQNMQLDWE